MMNLKRTILFQTLAVFLLGEGHFSQVLNVCGFNVARRTETLTAQPLVSEPSAFEPGLLLTSLRDTNHEVLIRFQQN